MAHLIDKDALVAEIERRRSKNAKNKLNLAASFEDNYLLSFIDALEVKEVDLDKEISKYLDNGMELQLDWRECNNITVNPNGLRSFAKHFLELGLKAQKGE